MRTIFAEATNLWKCIHRVFFIPFQIRMYGFRANWGINKRRRTHDEMELMLSVCVCLMRVFGEMRKKKDETMKEWSCCCCQAITVYSGKRNPAQFIVQYFMTTNDFRFVKRDDPWQHLYECKSKWAAANTHTHTSLRHTAEHERRSKCISGKTWETSWWLLLCGCMLDLFGNGMCRSTSLVV